MAAVSRLPPVMLSDATGSLDTFVANRSYLDIEVYQLWLDGNQVDQMSSHAALMDQMDDSPDSKQILLSYVADQIRSFRLLEKWLFCPVELADQLVFQLSDSCRMLLLEKYYAFDRNFMREILGRKFTHRARKTFEDDSYKTGIKLNSCYRQYENMRRVCKVVAGMNGNTTTNIQTAFLLPEILARDYASMLFMSIYRLETTGRKLQEYSCDDFLYCANEMMKGWTTRAQQAGQKPATDLLPASSEDTSDLRVDKDFLYAMKEFKFLLERETAEPLKRTIAQNLPPENANQDDSARTLILFALNIHHSKQLRLIFVDIAEKLIPLWKAACWNSENVASFLQSFVTSAQELNEFKSRDPRLAGLWRRFFCVFNVCVIRLYRGPTEPTKFVVKFET